MVRKYLIFLLSVMLMVPGCGQTYNQGSLERNNGDQIGTNDDRFGTLGQTNRPIRTEEQEAQVRSITVLSGQDPLDQVNAYKMNGQTYVPLIQVLQLLNLNVKENDNVIQAGFTDVFIKVRNNSDQATIDGEKKTLSTPVISKDNQTLISIKDLQKVLGTDAEIKTDENKLSITIPYENEDYGFPDDVNLDDLQTDQEQPVDIPAVSAATADRIIRTARKFMGVPYVFGSPSGYTRTFDCSSFTQYVYGVHGIDLPRISRHQAKLGSYVPVKDLRAGDLLFFYWPGRFKSNKIVGHVGIYMGNGYMIHSAPNTPYTTEGVQIINLSDPDNAFRKLYLGAKRGG
jgi:cell wall-associated NlpC family hydrolase